jgi:hypothetical protein
VHGRKLILTAAQATSPFVLDLPSHGGIGSPPRAEWRRPLNRPGSFKDTLFQSNRPGNDETPITPGRLLFLFDHLQSLEYWLSTSQPFR